MNDASAGVARNNLIRPDPAGRVNISTMKAATIDQIRAGMHLDQWVAPGAAIVDAELFEGVAGDRILHDHREQPDSERRAPQALIAAGLSRVGQPNRSQSAKRPHDRPSRNCCSWSSTTAKLKPIDREDITFSQTRWLLDHPPKPFHPERLPMRDARRTSPSSIFTAWPTQKAQQGGRTAR